MKEGYRIGYEYQIFVPLNYLRNRINDGVIEINQGEMLDYRFRTAQEFAYEGIVVDYETGVTGLDRLENEFGDYVEVIKLPDGGILYKLKDSVNIDSVLENMQNSLPISVSSVLMAEEILKECFKERGLR